MKRAFKINYHSFVDIITNSSSEIFISTDKKVIDFLKEMAKDKYDLGSDRIKLISGKKFKEDYYDDPPLDKINDDDEILVCDVDQSSGDEVYELMNLLNFKSI